MPFNTDIDRLIEIAKDVCVTASRKTKPPSISYELFIIKKFLDSINALTAQQQFFSSPSLIILKINRIYKFILSHEKILSDQEFDNYRDAFFKLIHLSDGLEWLKPNKLMSINTNEQMNRVLSSLRPIFLRRLLSFDAQTIKTRTAPVEALQVSTVLNRLNFLSAHKSSHNYSELQKIQMDLESFHTRAQKLTEPIS